MEATKQTHLIPWVTFILKKSKYCISSANVVQILINDKLTPLPNSPNYFLGITFVYGESYPIIDMRTLFGQPTLYSEIASFSSVKQGHIDWVNEFLAYAQNGSTFKLARDSSQCSFGKWTKSYISNNSNVNRIIRCIEKPHNELHSQVAILDKLKASDDNEGINAIIKKTKHLCYDVIIPLFDELVQLFKETHKGIVILLRKDDLKLGLLVDEIDSIENFSNCFFDDSSLQESNNKYIMNVITDESQKVYLEINNEELFNIIPTL